MKLINWIKKKIYTYKQEKQYKKKLAENHRGIYLKASSHECALDT